MMPYHWILLIDPFKNLLNAYRMILEDENLFKIKNYGSIDPLTLKKLTDQRREELK